MTRFYNNVSTVAACATVLLLSACGDTFSGPAPGGDHREERAASQELRPTDPSDPFGYEGTEVKSHVSTSGEFKIWWATGNGHAPPAADENGNLVPDYVEMVGEVADDLARDLRQSGWKLALEDTPPNGAEAPGGDGLFDIYLVDFSNGDGHYSRDWCRENEAGVTQCAGHFRLENDFAGLNYPSPEYAARLVLSHEYFHAVQAAYTADLPAWWSEGSATWYEEVFDPEQDDFERLTSLYFDDFERSLNDRQRGPSDGFSYGAAIFVYFVELQIGEEGVLAIFERLSDGEELLDALDAELDEGFLPLSDAFDIFATYNLFTDALAVSDHGYPDAGRFLGVRVQAQDVTGPFNWDLDAEPLATRYAKLTFDEAITLQKNELADFPGPPAFIAVNQSQYEAGGTVHRIETDSAVEFSPDMSPLYLVVSNGFTDDRRAATLEVRRPTTDDENADPDNGGNNSTDDPDDQPTEDSTDGASEGGCNTSGGPPTGIYPLILAAALFYRRRFTLRS